MNNFIKGKTSKIGFGPMANDFVQETTCSKCHYLIAHYELERLVLEETEDLFCGQNLCLQFVAPEAFN